MVQKSGEFGGSLEKSGEITAYYPGEVYILNAKPPNIDLGTNAP